VKKTTPFDKMEVGLPTTTKSKGEEPNG